MPGIGFQDLGRPFSNNNVGVFGINSQGVIVGSASGASPSRVAYRYDSVGGYSIVATGTSSANAYAISNSGFITGETNGQAFLYSPTAGLVNLGNSASAGLAVNESGQVTGFGRSNGQAFLYTPGTGVEYLSPPGASVSYGRGINDQGQVLVEALGGNLSSIGAFVYTPGSGYALLPQSTNVPVRVHDINNRGWVVGGRNSVGVLWLPGETAPIDLTSYIEEYFGGSYTVGGAVAVNDMGQIVGWVTEPNGTASGFILTIPAPTSIGVLGVGFLCGRRRR